MKHQFMPLFWGDFFANTLRLNTAQEVGAYLLLIAEAWEQGGVVRYDMARKVARVAPAHWPKVWAALEGLFEVERDAHGIPIRITCRRVLLELSIADKLRSKRKAAGMAGAIKRWGDPMANAMSNDSKRYGKRIAQPLRSQWQATKKEEDSSFLTAAREKESSNPPPRSLAALPDGSLARSAQTEPVEDKLDAADKNPPAIMSLAELNRRWRGNGA